MLFRFDEEGYFGYVLAGMCCIAVLDKPCLLYFLEKLFSFSPQVYVLYFN